MLAEVDGLASGVRAWSDEALAAAAAAEGRLLERAAALAAQSS